MRVREPMSVKDAGLVILTCGLMLILLGCTGEATPVEVAPTATAKSGAGPSIRRTPSPSSSPVPALPSTPSPTLTATPSPEPTPTPGPAPSVPVTITVLYDNNPGIPGLRTAWGFSCLVERGDSVVLFDTGGDGAVLLGNMRALGIDPRRIQAVVLSHVHADHTGGVWELLAANDRLTVFVPGAFPEDFKARLRREARVVEVSEPTEIAPGVSSTGPMGTSIIEQGLVVDTPRGAVLITGCAHPGIVKMVEKARAMRGKVHLVVGGFHLGGAGEARINRIVEDFRRLGVERVAPCHCSGERARRAFKREYGPDCILAGVGSRFRF